MIRIGIVGLGKIARDQHVPALRASTEFCIAGVADPRHRLEGVPSHPDLGVLLAAEPGIDAVVICTPPQLRGALAREALRAGKHVLLEKPPAATLAEVEMLRALAAGTGRTVLATWHARHAPGVAPAARWLGGRDVAAMRITWKEDVRQWHPGQDWIWQPGGFGVFDPGINALSIATLILPKLRLERATLVYPANRDAPIAAELAGRLENDAPFTADFDFRQTGQQTWEIAVETRDGGALLLSGGGDALSINGAAMPLSASREYPAIYDHFAALIASAGSELDSSPLALVADALLLGRRLAAGPFHDR